MAAYVIGEIEVMDPAAYQEYGKQVLATIQKFGGKFVVRGGKAEPLEGAAPKRIVVLEFPSLEQAKSWYHSADYAPLIKMRQKASRGRLIVVQGA
jgi:uncharacterized protein (DUF1330 family)